MEEIPNNAPVGTDECLLSLVISPSLADPAVDWLLEQPEITGFTSQPINGHGGAEHGMTPAEQVAGYQKRVLLQVHLPRQTLERVLPRLKDQFAGSGIHYWISPLIAAGHLA